jgi:6-phosphogluconate dehydrogenase
MFHVSTCPKGACGWTAGMYASKVVAYAQGFDMMRAASKQYGWDIDLGAMATMRRSNCTIRARFLDRIR